MDVFKYSEHYTEEEMEKENLFKVYERVYAIMVNSDLPCFSVCDGICENVESAYFLPFEDEFIQEKLGLSENPFKETQNFSEKINSMVSIDEKGSVEKHCPFSVNQVCTIHEVRPMDCRSFPIFPYFEQKERVQGMQFFVVDYCPIYSKLPKSFVESTVEAWRILFPYLPSWWWREYNSDLKCAGNLARARKVDFPLIT